MKYAASDPPNVTAEASVKFVPVITTAVPPPVAPVVLDNAETVGAGTYEYLSAATTEELPAGVVILTSTVPTAPAGAVAVICVPNELIE